MTSPSTSGPARGAAVRVRPLGLLITLAVTALAAWFLWTVLRDVGLKNFGERLLQASPALTLLAGAATVARYLLLALRWEVLARREAPVGIGQIAPVLMAGNFVSLVTPAVRIAGPILRAYYLSRETGRPRARFYGTIVADQASNFTIYGVVFASAGVMVSLQGRQAMAPALGAALLAALAGGLLLAARMLRDVHLGQPSRVGRLLRRGLGEGASGGWRARIIAWWEHLIESLSASVITSKGWWPSLALSIAAYALTVLPQWLAFAAVGRPVGVIDVAFAISGAGFAQVLLASPGGAGVTEASLVAVFLALGVDAESAAAGVLVARLINYLIVISWGGVSFLKLQQRYGRPTRQGD